MSNKIYKGQTVTIEGSMCGAEPPYSSKFASDASGNIEYIGECKNAKNDQDRAHYIEKLTYDSSGVISRVLVAQNKINANCTDISISISGPYIQITANNGDFTEAMPNDSINLETTQSIKARITKKIDDNNIQIAVTGFEHIINEPNAVISINDCIITLEHEFTKDYSKRRWDLRNRYIFA